MEVPPLPAAHEPPKKPGGLDPFRRAVWRGLGVLLPPLLTIVIFVWIGNTVLVYLLVPLENSARSILLTQYSKRIIEAEDVPKSATDGEAMIDGVLYKQHADGNYLPAGDLAYVVSQLGGAPAPKESADVYRVLVEQKYLRRELVIPLFLCVFLLVLYLFGKFLAAGVGRILWNQFERIIERLPLVRNVYSSVKQVTDFMFSEQEIEYTRVIAIEYPRKGIWSLGLVTGESMVDIRAAANEPVLSVLIPTSPMPFTGYTINVKRSEAVDLNITLDQAFQFIVSCGVVVPPQQIQNGSDHALPGADPEATVVAES